jgi:hypothetical protein
LADYTDDLADVHTLKSAGLSKNLLTTLAQSVFDAKAQESGFRVVY